MTSCGDYVPNNTESKCECSYTPNFSSNPDCQYETDRLGNIIGNKIQSIAEENSTDFNKNVERINLEKSSSSITTTTFFIADTHFNHTNIIKYCNRPFVSSEDQTNKLIEKWNSTVKDEDTVFVLGDFFFFYNPKEWNENNVHKFVNEMNECTRILSQLKGHKHLIKGNHDVRSDKQYSEMGFEFVSPYPIIYDNFFILSHEPLLLSNTIPYFNLYGHVHNDPRFEDTSTSKCVSVERINYAPVSLERIRFEIETWIF